MISDTHGFHRDPHLEIPDGDILIHAGDLSMSGEYNVLMDTAEWFKELDFEDTIVIGGNHDISLGGKDMLGFKIFEGVHYLEESSIEVQGKKIWGSPYTPWNHEYIANMFAFGKERPDMSWSIPKDTDIAVTHCPPFGYGDLLAEGSSDPNTHIGDKQLLNKLWEIKPTLNVFGHIHEGYGIYEENPITFVNASVVDERYNLNNDPVVMYL